MTAGARRAGFGSALAAVALALAAPVLAGHGAGGTLLSYDAGYVKQLMDTGEALVLVDLRPPDAYRKAHLPGARSLPLSELEARVAEVPRAGRVVLYADLASAAALAFVTLDQRGYRNVAVLDEGFAGWLKRGFPVEVGPAQPGTAPR